jgi:hypothetical protein
LLNRNDDVPCPERERLEHASDHRHAWRKWGPYLSERQWGTVREDYSEDGNFWDYFDHDIARSRAYRWGEDGIAGFSDDRQRICFSLGLWNGRDPILKERLYGLNPAEGNHGEDVKECYYYLDATPTHSYLKMLYKYPQRAFPYQALKDENRQRGSSAREFELLDTGVLDDNRYFDVFVEYAKAAPEDILIRITAVNRGSVAAPLHILPQIWFRNRWSWGDQNPKPILRLAEASIDAEYPQFGNYHLYFEGDPVPLFTENETNARRVYGHNDTPGFFKDAFHEYIVDKNGDAVNPEQTGTKAALAYAQNVRGGDSAVIRLRLTNSDAQQPFADFDEVFQQRIHEADTFFASIQGAIDGEDRRRIHRQALAGMVWSKQFYFYDVWRWLKGDPSQPKPPPARWSGRNHEWQHLMSDDIISMPDTWEFPWYASWDLAIHCITFALIDPAFAKDQILLLTREWYMRSNGQLPAFEAHFGSSNPPIHAWATWRVYRADQRQNGGDGDLAFLERAFHKLTMNFTWWVNRQDQHGRNIFEGGFLGLDNIGVIDRGAPMPDGFRLDQADATSWMAMYCLDMMRIALELAQHNPVYEDSATKFYQHFLQIAKAINTPRQDGVGLWDEEEQFFYDLLNTPDDTAIPLKVRSIVGLIPLLAIEIIDSKKLEGLPYFRNHVNRFLEKRPDLAALVTDRGASGGTRMLSLLSEGRMKALLTQMLDESNFLSDFGVRSLSKLHKDNPCSFHYLDREHSVSYEPGESESLHWGGNSNWRGPIWIPMNYFIIESLLEYHKFYGDTFKIEYPTGSGNELTLQQIAHKLTDRLADIFLRGEADRRPLFGTQSKLQTDPHFRDCILFHEYFHGDDGRGCGASHQTGWTGLIANLLQGDI